MSLFSTIGHLAQEYKEARTRYLTARQIGALPDEIQKDIGWPPVESGVKNHGTGHWAGFR